MVHQFDWILTDTTRLKKTHTNHIALAAVSAANGFIFPFIGKVKKSLSHLFICLGDSFSPHASQPQHLSGCPSRGAAEGKLSLSGHHVWAVLCPGAHICNPGTLQNFSLGFFLGGKRRMQEDGALVTQVWGQTGFPTWALMMDGSGLCKMHFYFWVFVKNYPELGINFSVQWSQNVSR